jgi:hypothetical protein
MADRPVLDGEKVETQDVEITPEMLRAGLTAFEHLSESTPDFLLVEVIYKAMAAAKSQ